MKAKVEEGRKKLADEIGLRVTPASGWKPFRNTPTSRNWDAATLNRLIKKSLSMRA